MMAGGLSVNQKVFEELKQAYSEKFGSSPSALIHRLNHTFAEDLDEPDADLIADRTIRNFFNAPVPPKMQEKNLNYLCIVLLGYRSYQDAYRQLLKTELYLQGDWLDPYWKRLERKCSTIKILDMTRPVSLEDLYVKVNVLETPPGRRRKRLDDILAMLNANKNSGVKRFEAFSERGIDALEVVKREKALLILGAPGAGKTTFLKSLAMYFPSEEPGIIPVFLRLKEFAESEDRLSLVKAITTEFTSCLPDATQFVQEAMKHGHLLILLDALDEVVIDDVPQVCQEIQEFSRNYEKNRFIVTSRIGACDSVLENFSEVQIADFEKSQIDKLVVSWFTQRDQPQYSERFLKELDKNQPIKELAKTPLLLTMLCWMFQEIFSFPKNRSALYREMVYVLLRKWDASRIIDRETIVKNQLPAERKEQLFGEIAYNGFSCNPPKLVWEKQELEYQIRSFIQNIQGLETTPADVLRLIEVQHGLLIEQARDIFTFSHLTFQEYFAAEHIVEDRNPHLIPQIIQAHLTDRSWRETLIVIAGRLPNADEFLKLMFYYTNEIAKSRALQTMLAWLDQVTRSSGVGTSGWRAFYLALDLDADLYISNDINLDRSLAQDFATALRDLNAERRKKQPKTEGANLTLSLAAIHGLVSEQGELSSKQSIENATSEFQQEQQKIAEIENIGLQLKFAAVLADKLGRSRLADEITVLQKDYAGLSDASQVNRSWIDRLNKLMTEYLDIGHSVEFCDADAKALEKYIYANALLLECIRGGYSSTNLREEIIESLLLPLERIPEDLRQVPKFSN